MLLETPFTNLLIITTIYACHHSRSAPFVFDEMLDEVSREKAKMLVLEFEWSPPVTVSEGSWSVAEEVRQNRSSVPMGAEMGARRGSSRKRGVSARIDGKVVFVGSRRLFGEIGPGATALDAALAREGAPSGRTVSRPRLCMTPYRLCVR